MDDRSNEHDLAELNETLKLVNSEGFEEISEYHHATDQPINNTTGETGVSDDELDEQLVSDVVSNEQYTDGQSNTESNGFISLLSNDFASREELQNSVRDIALRLGFVVVIKKSKANYYVKLGCDRGGTYRRAHIPVEQRKRSTGSRLINCPFEIWGRRKGEVWKVEIKDPSHNHEHSTDMSGHPMCRRFSEDEIEIIKALSKSGSAPREIITTLRQRNPALKANSRNLYNTRYKLKQEQLGDRTVLEALLEELGDGGFFYDIARDKDDRLTHLFFAHPSSVILMRNFPDVFIMDCTYKTNRYNMPALNIIGISSFNTSFYSCIVFMQKEEEKDYVWALERFKKILGNENSPKVIITDRELALMNAINKVFPQTTNLLCIWHIQKNVLAKCKKHFEKNEAFDNFLATWTRVMYSPDESSFDMEWNLFKAEYQDKSLALDYIENNWLPFKEKFVLAWAEKFLHLGNHATSRAEGAHATLKKYLQVSTGNLREVKEKICLAIENQVEEIKTTLQIEKIRVPLVFRIPLFQGLVGKVSSHALGKIFEQYELATSGKLLDNCTGNFQSTMGLPCAHKLTSMLNGRLEISDVHQQWRLEGRSFVSTDEEFGSKDDFLDDLLKSFRNKYMKMPLVQKEDTQRQICQIVDTSIPSIIQDPRIYPRRGRPAGSKKRKNDNSTRRDPSEFEIVEKSQHCGPSRYAYTHGENSEINVSLDIFRDCSREGEKNWQDHGISSSHSLLICELVVLMRIGDIKIKFEVNKD